MILVACCLVDTLINWTNDSSYIQH